APTCGHLGEDLPLTWREVVEGRGMAHPVGRQELLYETRVDRGAALCDRFDRGQEIVPVVDPLLQEISPALCSALEEGEGIPRSGVLAQDDDADFGVRLTQLASDTNPLVVAGRWHPDVGDHDIGRIRLDRRQERVAVGV